MDNLLTNKTFQDKPKVKMLETETSMLRFSKEKLDLEILKTN